MKIQLKITKIRNGFIVDSLENGDKFSEVIECFEESNLVKGFEDMDSDEASDKQTMTRLLEKVAEYFGIIYQGFSKHNLNISWNKLGDEVEDEEEGEKI